MLDYNIWPRVEREWDEPEEERDCYMSETCSNQDGTNSECDYIESEDYEQDEILEDEESGDLWEDLGCSWRDYV